MSSLVVAVVSAAPDADAFVGGVIVALKLFFALLVLLSGVSIVRRIVAA